MLNGSGVEGVASAEADKLSTQGFRTGHIGNADEGSYTTTVYQLSTDKPATLEALKKLYGDNIVVSDFPFRYTTDADFVIIVG
ncbi:MAG: LytR C-terminal domain-containing protein [Candidatus Nomurabacteria bacterium]|nr:LytR C-terminal domain-containing protein [Candidatus Nomurabacteria bacterium]